MKLMTITEAVFASSQGGNDEGCVTVRVQTEDTSLVPLNVILVAVCIVLSSDLILLQDFAVSSSAIILFNRVPRPCKKFRKSKSDQIGLNWMPRSVETLQKILISRLAGVPLGSPGDECINV